MSSSPAGSLPCSGLATLLASAPSPLLSMLLHGASVPRRLRAVRWVLAGRAFASAESPTAAPSKSALLTELQLLPPFAGSPAASVTRERLRALLPARHPLAVRQSLAAWPVLAAAVLEYLVVVAQPARRRSRKAQPPATAAAKNDPRPPSAAVSAPKPKPAAAADAVRAPRQPRAPPGVVAAPPPPAPPPAAAVAGSAPPAAATAQPPPPPAAVATASSPAAQPAAPPPTPRPYQETGIEFILAQKAALLADDSALPTNDNTTSPSLVSPFPASGARQDGAGAGCAKPPARRGRRGCCLPGFPEIELGKRGQTLAARPQRAHCAEGRPALAGCGARF